MGIQRWYLRRYISDRIKQENIAPVIIMPLLARSLENAVAGVSNLLHGDFIARIMQIEADNHVFPIHGSRGSFYES